MSRAAPPHRVGQEAARLTILPCGHRSLRFRPPLDITAAEVDEAIDIIRRAIGHVVPGRV